MIPVDMIPGVVSYKKEDIDRYRSKRWWLGLTLGDVIDRAADLYPDKEAVVDRNERFTFGQLRTRSERLASALIDLGIGPKDRVMIQLPNRSSFICIFYALQKIGAIPPVMVFPKSISYAGS